MKRSDASLAGQAVAVMPAASVAACSIATCARLRCSAIITRQNAVARHGDGVAVGVSVDIAVVVVVVATAAGGESAGRLLGGDEDALPVPVFDDHEDEEDDEVCSGAVSHPHPVLPELVLFDDRHCAYM